MLRQGPRQFSVGDKELLRDPETANARIYVGKLDESVTKESLETQFQKYGTIVGTVLNVTGGFAFIQYENEQCTEEAIKNENQNTFLGKKIIVRQALSQNENSGNFNRGRGGNDGGPMRGGRGGFDNTSNRGGFDNTSNRGGFDNASKRGGFDGGSSNRGGFDGSFNRGGFDGSSNRGGFDGSSNRGGFDGSSNRGGFDGSSNRGSFEGSSRGGGGTRNDGRDNFNKNRGGTAGNRGAVGNRSGAITNRGGFDNNHGNRRGGRGRGSRGGGNMNNSLGGNNDRDRSPLSMGDRGTTDWRDNSNSGYGYNSNEKFGESSYSTGNNSFGPPMNTFSIPERNTGSAGPVGSTPERNDCEIIVVSKLLTEYAEYIEDRLKRMGLSVDLLFPNEDVPIGRVLGNISGRGCLYAILIMPQNEEHRSLTVNILYGLPQEHRNMPVDDAFFLIDRNFKAYMRGEKAGAPSAVAIIPAKASMASLHERHPENIQSLVNLLAGNRPLTVLQYDKIIRYLQERRELQVKFELGEGSEMETDTTPNKTHHELQQRILNILNQTSSSSPTSTVPDVVSLPAATVQAQPTSTTTTPLLHDPTVQKALDSLLQGNLLQNLGGNSKF